MYGNCARILEGLETGNPRELKSPSHSNNIFIFTEVEISKLSELIIFRNIILFLKNLLFFSRLFIIEETKNGEIQHGKQQSLSYCGPNELRFCQRSTIL